VNNSVSHGLLWVCALFVFFSNIDPAHAYNKVASPDVTQGLFSLEYRVGRDFDDKAKMNDQDLDRFVASYGVTDRWKTALSLTYAGPDNNLTQTYIGWTNEYQFVKGEDAWCRFALQESYWFSLVPGQPDKMRAKVVAAKNIGLFSNYLNINFQNSANPYRNADLDPGIAWKTKYMYMPEFAPGFEFYADFGKLDAHTPLSQDKYQIGPMISGQVGKNVKYDFGYLFGVSEAAPDGRIKLILTYAF